MNMSIKGDCWDNVLIEHFFQRLKSESLSNGRFVTRKARLHRSG